MDPDKLLIKSPYWDLEHVEKSKKIISSLSKISSDERNALFKNFLDAKNGNFQTPKVHAIIMSQEDSSVMLNFIHDTRYIYNVIISYLKSITHKIEPEEALEIINKELNLSSDPIIIANKQRTPLDIQKEACHDAIQAHNNALDDGLSTEDVKFMTKKNPYPTMTLPKNSISSIREDLVNIYPDFIKNPVKIEGLQNIPNSNFKISWNRKTNAWRMIVPSLVDRKTYRTVIIDPGITDPLTCLDFENGKINQYVLGKNWYEELDIEKRINRIYQYENTSIDLLKTKKERKQYLILEKIVWFDRRKILNRIDNMNKSHARYLVDKYDVIVLPKLDMTSMNIGLDEKAQLKAKLLAHFNFYDYLTRKAKSSGKVVVNQDEAYTTKTCYECGFQTNIRGDKKFKCCNKECNNVCHRDFQACLNILTRYMSYYQASLTN